MTTKHTPGPWRVDNHCDVAAQDRHVATPSLYGDGSDEANARLIAAAPDLLHVAEMVLRGAADGALYGFAKAAVDKAKGKS